MTDQIKLEELLGHPFDTNPPDFVNEEGVKWWYVKDLSEYAHQKDQNGISLPDVHVWYIEQPNGRQTRVLVNGSKVLYDTTNFEEMSVRIDIMKADIHFNGGSKASSRKPKKETIVS